MRMQPLHKGHQKIIDAMLAENEIAYLGIGSPTARDEKNPFSLLARKRMLQGLYGEEIASGRLVVLLIDDIHNRPRWVGHVNNTIAQVVGEDNLPDTYYCGSDQDGELFEEKGFKVRTFARGDLPITASGIREKLRASLYDWANDVPEKIVSIVEAFYNERDGSMSHTEKIKAKLVAGLKDFCDKNGFKEVTMGLSGGVDSAVVLALACEAVGPGNVHAIMMKTEYTSQESLLLAAEAAKLNGVDYRCLDIQPAVDALKKAIDFEPKVKTTPENLQARVRGLISMAYSNENRWLVLACGNKSELAMGYCTLYGDMCGSLAPIGDIYKTEVYAMAELYNQEGNFFVPEGILKRAPTAELSHGQKDQDALPPYSVLDIILHKYVYGNAEPEEEEKELVEWVRQKFQANEFKRRQAAPVIEITENDRK